MTREQALKEIEKLNKEKEEFVVIRNSCLQVGDRNSLTYRYAQECIREYNQTINNIRNSYIEME